MQLCLAVFGLDRGRKEQCTRVCAEITPVLLLSETTKTGMGFLNIARMESTRIVRPSGSLNLTERPPSCWKRAPLALWIPGSGNGTLCPGYLIGHARSCAPLSRSKYSAPACLRVDDRELMVTPPSVMIPPFCCTSGLHQRASIVLGVCEGYDTVEAVSESELVCTTSNCLPLPFPFLLFFPLFVLVLLLFDLSYAPPPGLQQSFTQCPVLPQFLQVLMSVLLVLLVRVPFWFWYLPLPFLFAFLVRVNLHLVVTIRTCSIPS